MIWFKANYPALLAALTALYTLLSVINGLIKNPEANGFIAKILDGISFIVRQGGVGSVKVPFSRSRKPGGAPVVVGTSVPPAVVALLLIPVLMLGACSWGACYLNQLAASKQTLIEEVSVDLASADDHVVDATGDLLVDGVVRVE